MISERAVPVFGNELRSTLVFATSWCVEMQSTYRRPVVVLARIHTCRCRSIRRHGLIAVFPELPHHMLFIVVHALDNLWTDERTFRDDALERNHVVQVC